MYIWYLFAMEPFMTSEELHLARQIGSLNYLNPFTSERLDCEREILGKDAVVGLLVWHNANGGKPSNPNVAKIHERCVWLSARLEERLRRGRVEISREVFQAYDEFSIYCLYDRYFPQLTDSLKQGMTTTRVPFFPEFRVDFQNRLQGMPGRFESQFSCGKTFAVFHQICRAFHAVFGDIAGGSEEAARLRAKIWQSIFTHDIARYHRLLFDRMNQITTLITGESGTGKELVARAIGLSQYIPFDEARGEFVQDNQSSFKALQLSAMPQSIIESELFGHIRGAYTGAVADHAGYLEICTPCDSIFLDEIGETSLEMQIKLLRVLQSRSFQRLGDIAPRAFQGKLLAATNRNLVKECQKGNFRSDLFYRLCADAIETVPLRCMLNGGDEELYRFVKVLSLRILQDDSEAVSFADEACDWIRKNLGLKYPWPGNVRELEQCLRNLLIRGSYAPSSAIGSGKAGEGSSGEYFRDCRLTAEEVMRQYLQALYEREGNLARTAAAAGLDRRTVRKYLEKLPPDASDISSPP